MAYESLVQRTANKYGVPFDLAMAVMRQESGGNPNAISSKGAIGLFQLMPATAKELKVDPSIPEQNIDGGLRYLSKQYERFGDWGLALAAYNAGAGNVLKYGGIPPFAETQNYVKAILGNAGVRSDEYSYPFQVVRSLKTVAVQADNPSPSQVETSLVVMGGINRTSYLRMLMTELKKQGLA